MTALGDVLAPALFHPIFGVTVTLTVYACCAGIYQRAGCASFLHPVLTSTSLLGILLLATGLPYSRYFAQSFPLHVGLGLLIVLLAVPLYRQLPVISEAHRALLVALPLGWLAALLTALALPILRGAPNEVIVTLAPKSATAAVAVELAEGAGGMAPLTALAVISSGLFGAAFGPSLIAAAGVRDHRAIGFALGLASHALGTARAFQISDTAGAFASVGMILNAILTILLFPVVLALV